MPQGKFKTKSQVPSLKGKNKQSRASLKKKNQPKRGARCIAPKKARQIEAAKLKKNISKAISARNEEDIIAQAASKEHKQLSVATPAGKGDAKSSKLKK